MLGGNFEQFITIAFMAEEDHDYAAALSHLIKASKVAKTTSEMMQCRSAIKLCIDELENTCDHHEDLSQIKSHYLNSSSAYILS